MNRSNRTWPVICFVNDESMALLFPGYRNPGEYGIDYEDLMVPTSDGVRVHAWLMKQSEPATRPTLIFFHGNAGSTSATWLQRFGPLSSWLMMVPRGLFRTIDIGYRLPNAIQLYRKVGVNVVLVDYRGFGHSDGEPSEKGIKLDAEVGCRAHLVA